MKVRQILELVCLLNLLMRCASYHQKGIEVASKGTYCDPRYEPTDDSTFTPKKNIDAILEAPLRKNTQALPITN